MSFIRNFVGFWYDFIVGDDWFIAAGVIVVLVIASAVARANLQTIAWVAMPVGVVLILAVSLWRASLSSRVSPAHAPKNPSEV